MQEQKRRNLSGSKAVVALLIAVLATGSLFAKGGEKRLAGTVKSIGNDYVTIETKTHQLLTVKITSATKFLKNKKASSLSEMKTGNQVVFLATASSDTASANTPSADTSSTTNTHATNTQKDSLSLGIGFTAVQASF